MLVLALDTTMRGGSCALVRDGAVVRERAGDASRSQAERLPAELMALLAETETPLPAVDAFAVATGPGSFTGLRVGIATMQGLAFAEGKPLVGVSTFDALAAVADRAAGAAEPPARIATWIDAWRGEVFAMLYEGRRAVEPPVVSPPAPLLARLRGRPTIFIGDGAERYRDLIAAVLGDEERLADPPAPFLAGTIGELAFARVRAGERPPPHAVRPLYVRRPDAELARLANDARTNR